MNPIQEFSAFEGKKYAAATRRVYLSAAKKVLKIVGKAPEDCKSYEELLAFVARKCGSKEGAKSAPY